MHLFKKSYNILNNEQLKRLMVIPSSKRTLKNRLSALVHKKHKRSTRRRRKQTLRHGKSKSRKRGKKRRKRKRKMSAKKRT